ncbi:MAG: hypothetical protein ACM3MI_06230 [Clostridiales bacterium]
MNSLGQPELEYEGVTHDIQKLFHDPKAGADALMRRIKAIDRDTSKAILASRRDISEEDAERIINKIENARDGEILLFSILVYNRLNRYTCFFRTGWIKTAFFRFPV